MTGSPRRNAVAVLVITGALVCGSCGLSAEKRPHRISNGVIVGLVPHASSTTVPVSNEAELQAALYFVKGERLQRVFVPAAAGSVTVQRALDLLLEGPPPVPKGLTTSIPPGTTLRGVHQSGSTLRIDLSGEIKSLGGSAAKAAYAQLVFTALDLPGVKRVHFAIEGDDIDAITDDGSLTVITAKNYQRPLNPH